MINSYNLNIKQAASLAQLAQSIYNSNPSNKELTFMDITDVVIRIFLSDLHRFKVEYLIVGGLATVIYGYIRTTPNLDLWIKDSSKNKA